MWSPGHPVALGVGEASPDSRPELGAELGLWEAGRPKPLEAGVWIEGPWVQAVNWGLIQGGEKGFLRGVCLGEASQSLAPWRLREEASCCPPYQYALHTSFQEGEAAQLPWRLCQPPSLPP